MGATTAHPARLVGRQAELETAREAMDTGARGVLFVGQPGVGKTSLARAFLGGLAHEPDNEIVCLAAPAPNPQIPFGVFARFVPAIGAQSDCFLAFHAVRNAILARAEERQLVLGIDDGHRLDDYSAGLLFQLVADKDARAVIAMDAGAEGPEAVRLLWKEGVVARVDVEPLSRDESTEVVRQVLGQGSDPARPTHIGGELAEALWKISLGNPLYLRELIGAARRSGTIMMKGNVWRLSGHLSPGARLTELLHDRLDRVSEGELATLEAVAFAEPVPLRVLTRIARADDIAALQRAGLIRTEGSRGEQTVLTAHPLHREVLRSTLPATRSGQLGSTLARAFDADDRTSGDLVRVVSWRLDSDDPPPPGLILEAALHAAEQQDWNQSCQLAEAAWTRGAGSEALLALSDALCRLGRFEAALGALGSLEASSDGDVTRAAILGATALYLGLGQYEAAEQTLTGALNKVTDLSQRTRLQGLQAALLTLAGMPAEAVARFGHLVARSHDETLRAGLALALSHCGQGADALELVDGDLKPYGVAATLAAAAKSMALRLDGQVADLAEMAAAEYDLAVELDDPYRRSQGACIQGWVALSRGRVDSAISHFQEAATDSGTALFVDSRVESLCGLTEALALVGEVDGAAAAAAAAHLEAQRQDDMSPLPIIASAWLVAAEGAFSDAVGRLDEAADWARERGQTAMEVLALHAGVRLGSGHASARLLALADWVHGRLVQVVAEHASALARPYDAGPALDLVSQRYAAMSLELFAAEASAQASRYHRTAGYARRAIASAARAYFLVGGHDGPRPVALTLALPPPDLTRRENEVARLAVSGLSSQAIATKLTLSVRTVETHLARVYFKLGITGRAELAAALRADLPAVPTLRPATLRAVEAG